METVQFVIALLAILASVISIAVFNRVRKQHDLLSSGCWNGDIILELVDGSEIRLGENPSLDLGRRSERGYRSGKVVLPASPIRKIRFCGCAKYLPNMDVSAGEQAISHMLYVNKKWPYGEAELSFESPLTLEQDVWINVFDDVTNRRLEFSSFHRSTKEAKSVSLWTYVERKS